VDPLVAKCHLCGEVLDTAGNQAPTGANVTGRDGLTTGERFKAWLCSIFGGILAFLGGIGMLLSVAMAISGPSLADRPNYSGGQWIGVVLVFLAVFVLPPLAGGIALLRGGRNIRRRARPGVRPQMATPVPRDAVTQAEVEIRLLLKGLKGPYRAAAGRLTEELRDLLHRHREMEKRLNALNAMAVAMPGMELDSQRAAILLRLETETDPVIVESLRNQLLGVDGQIEARETVETTCARLKAARDASLQTLLHLRAELQALSANASDRGREALEAETSDMRELGETLRQTRHASEEVLRISQQ
jgi:hypothetical protein